MCKSLILASAMLATAAAFGRRPTAQRGGTFVYHINATHAPPRCGEVNVSNTELLFALRTRDYPVKKGKCSQVGYSVKGGTGVAQAQPATATYTAGRRRYTVNLFYTSKLTAPKAKNIVQLAQATSTLSTLVTAVVKAGLAKTLSGKGPFTVFAPTNAAFAALPKGLLAQLLLPANKAKLQQVLEYHVVSGTVTAQQIMGMDGKHLVTLDQKLSITVGVDRVGNRVKIDLNEKTQVTAGNIKASNGLVHIVNHVLIPPGFKLAPQGKNIVQTAQSVKTLSTLVTAVVKAGLAGVLSGKGPFTVFAPTNAAFAALPKGMLARLLEPKNKATLQKILKYHVHSGAVLSKQLKDGMKVSTLDGKSLPVGIDVYEGKTHVDIGNAQVSMANVKCTNGVVHVINKVLLPPGLRLPKN